MLGARLLEDGGLRPSITLSCRRAVIAGTTEGMIQPAPVHLFLTTIEVAEMLRISRRTLERMRVEGTGPRFLKVGPGKRSRVLYRQGDVEEWIGKFNYGSTSEYGR